MGDGASMATARGAAAPVAGFENLPDHPQEALAGCPARRLFRGGGAPLGDAGAGAVVLGCAGMAPVRARLEQDAGLAVIDPVQAAAAMALGLAGPPQ
ncbi:aspartate/glutamate racemase family protein [Mangrovicoccus ximenensis]|uniref:aspartate/glutamate racemase family protein n=1 Tax=Mangrovicoccus ximenensis TaxID=1911570 RepID=UPI000D35F554|nr:aspartate/glutamate racemase family protein [Mangrovicoccus ximenensis]